MSAAPPDLDHATTSLPAAGGGSAPATRAGGERYLLLEELGGGGRGAVHAAFDRQLDRKVALARGLGHGDAAVREAQALARLVHPNVVTVYDVGLAEEDRWFAAMELVDGSPLPAWLAARPRSWREVVAVFVDAGRGLAAAHAAGLVHPELDAGAIVVGADGRGRVAAFGVARILADGGDPRDDQAALCAALRGALGAAPVFVRRVIERGGRADPEARYPDMNALVAALGHDPARGRRRLLGALLAAAAAAGLLLAVQAWRARRAALCTGADRRIAALWDDGRRDAVHAAFAAVPLPYAARAGERSIAGVDAWTVRWAAAHRDACAATRLRGERSVRVMDARMDCLSELLADAGAVVDALAAADAATVNRADLLVVSLPAVADCDQVRDDGERLPADPARRAAIAEVQGATAHARALSVLGRSGEALAAATAVLPAARALVYPRAEVRALLALGGAQQGTGDAASAEASFEQALLGAARLGDPRLLVSAAAALAIDVGGLQRRFDEGRRHGRLALAIAERLGDDQATARAHQALGLIDVAALRGADAEAHLRIAAGLLERVGGADDVRVNNLRNSLGNAVKLQGRSDDALELLAVALASQERTLGPDHANVATTLYTIAGSYYELERFGEAEPLLLRAIEIRRAAAGPRSVDVADAVAQLGWVRWELGHYPEAERDFRTALEIYAGLPDGGTGHPDRAPRALRGLAVTLVAEHRLDEAAEAAGAAFAAAEKALGPDHLDLAPVLSTLAHIEAERGNEAAAEAALQRALAIPGVAGSPNELLFLVNLAGLQLNADRNAAAGATIDRALAVIARDHAAGGSPRAGLAVEVGGALVTLGRAGEAVPLLEEAVAAAEGGAGEQGDPGGAAWPRFTLARALWDAGGDRARARRLAEQARDALAGGDAYKRAAVTTWLAERPESR